MLPSDLQLTLDSLSYSGDPIHNDSPRRDVEWALSLCEKRRTVLKAAAILFTSTDHEAQEELAFKRMVEDGAHAMLTSILASKQVEVLLGSTTASGRSHATPQPVVGGLMPTIVISSPKFNPLDGSIEVLSEPESGLGQVLEFATESDWARYIEGVCLHPAEAPQVTADVFLSNLADLGLDPAVYVNECVWRLTHNVEAPATTLALEPFPSAFGNPAMYFRDPSPARRSLVIPEHQWDWGHGEPLSALE